MIVAIDHRAPSVASWKGADLLLASHRPWLKNERSTAVGALKCWHAARKHRVALANAIQFLTSLSAMLGVAAAIVELNNGNIRPICKQLRSEGNRCREVGDPIRASRCFLALAAIQWLEDQKHARSTVEEVAELQPANPDVAGLQAALLMVTGDPAEAIEPAKKQSTLCLQRSDAASAARAHGELGLALLSCDAPESPEAEFLQALNVYRGQDETPEIQAEIARQYLHLAIASQQSAAPEPDTHFNDAEMVAATLADPTLVAWVGLFRYLSCIREQAAPALQGKEVEKLSGAIDDPVYADLLSPQAQHLRHHLWIFKAIPAVTAVFFISLMIFLQSQNPDSVLNRLIDANDSRSDELTRSQISALTLTQQLDHARQLLEDRKISKAQRFAEEILARAKQQQNAEVKRKTQLLLTDIHQRSGNHKQADFYIRQVLKTAHPGTDSGTLNDRLGQIRFENGRYTAARRAWRAAVDHFRIAGDHTLTAIMNNNIGHTYRHQGRPIKAAEQYWEAMRISVENNNGYGQATAHSNLALALRMSDNLVGAEDHTRMAITLLRSYNNPSALARQYASLSNIARDQGKQDDACRHTGTAMSVLLGRENSPLFGQLMKLHIDHGCAG